MNTGKNLASNIFEFTDVDIMVEAMMEHDCGDKRWRCEDDPRLRKYGYKCNCEKYFKIGLNHVKYRVNPVRHEVNWNMPEDRIDFADKMNGGLLVVYDSDEVWL